jgi:hypothetical protein
MEQDPLLQEVHDDVRRDRLEALWKRYGAVIIATILLVVGSIGGWQFWLYWQEETEKKHALAYSQALAKANGSPSDLSELAEMSEEQEGSYGAFAALQHAAHLHMQDDWQASFEAYMALWSEDEHDMAWRELALLQAGYVAFMEEAESEWRDDVHDAMKERLQGRPAPVYPGLMQEWLGMYYWRQGDHASARPMLEAILSDYNSPANLLQRTEKMLSLLKPLPAGGDEKVDEEGADEDA